jgi:uncharacterized protein YjiS (DUF1127 family)
VSRSSGNLFLAALSGGIARCAQDNEALLVLAELDNRSLQDLGIVRTAYMRAASNLPSTE